jgi:CSLREA domain-containing protein
MWVGRARALAYFVLALVVVVSIGVLAAKPAHATTFTVNSTGDEADKSPGDGICQITTADQCTLRAAIQESNGFTGADTIAFNIPGDDPHRISPATELPTITQRVIIDGYTQGDATSTPSDDATENTLTQPDKTNAALKIELHGATARNYCYGLNVDANSVVIRGLVINNFEFCGAANSSSAPGIRLSGGTGHRVEGNFIGTNATGTAIDRNARGVSLIEADGSTIGGTAPEDRNLISGNVRSGVEAVGGSSGNTIRGNIIGPDKNGDPLADSNAVDGGVVISSGTGNRILSNSIFSNEALGIDLAGGSENIFGVTTTDDTDPDTGANRLQNYPVITSIFTTREPLVGTTINISGRLNSTPSTRVTKRTFIIQLFSSPRKDTSGFGEGQTFLGQDTVTTNRNGNATFGFSTSAASVGDFITATATSKSTGDTSEFSKAKLVEEPVINPG